MSPGQSPQLKLCGWLAGRTALSSFKASGIEVEFGSLGLNATSRAATCWPLHHQPVTLSSTVLRSLVRCSTCIWPKHPGAVTDLDGVNAKMRISSVSDTISPQDLSTSALPANCWFGLKSDTRPY